MRKYKRFIAHHIMKIQGIERINKPRVAADGSMTGQSYFAEHWRDYVGLLSGRKPKKTKGRMTKRQMLFHARGNA